MRTNILHGHKEKMIVNEGEKGKMVNVIVT